MALRGILQNLPEVRSPVEKKIGFNTKLKWTLIILISFFVLSNIPLYGITKGSLDRFEYLAILLGTSFGSIISLGVGPIVMGSIIIQLLVGAQIINIDLTTPEGKKFHGALQKLMSFAFVIFEAMVYVLMKGIQANPGFIVLVIFELCLGGILVIFMDDVVQKWGFGSGVSLFIGAGIGWRLMSSLFSFFNVLVNEVGVKTIQYGPYGKVLGFVWAIINGDGTTALVSIMPIIITAILFFIVVFAQSLKVEIPLAYDRIRGFSSKWPLPFFYAGVMPVILVSALAANIQLFASLLQSWLGHATILGGFNSSAVPVSGIAFWIHSTTLLDVILKGSFSWQLGVQAVGHILFYTFFSILFAYFWVSTSGQDAGGQAKRIISSGMSIPGFRKDERVLESILKRYVGPLTVMGGAAIGLLASIADLFGALVGGTAILLMIMVFYQFYQNIAQQHAMDMNPALRSFFGG